MNKRKKFYTDQNILYSYLFFYFSVFFIIHFLSSTLLSSFFNISYISRAIDKIASVCKRFLYDIYMIYNYVAEICMNEKLYMYISIRIT